MKLNPEGVEKAKDALVNRSMLGGSIEEEVRAALTAYFDHLKEVGLMRECRVWDHSGSDYWAANTGSARMLPNDFMGFIIKQEE